ncbi:hypothetical protein NEOLI_003641 [Neolecta irregularis DAH-3]|uniref:Uncharacterized protein n=1 Tax=Neolecta irregularis (strain DAH-3) TaxID=1198029 RepID=A0A1U7LTE8_NEOID|nr:hypothetical protein NEOLI_003641 [Neolecta irregularis DAH-3]|eukprot:OLL25791.1 hypothetical protein NEOLI_003641 [Neolecta irregularis DAH-3]
MLSAAYAWWLVLRQCSRQPVVCQAHIAHPPHIFGHLPVAGQLHIVHQPPGGNRPPVVGQPPVFNQPPAVNHPPVAGLLPIASRQPAPNHPPFLNQPPVKAVLAPLDSPRLLWIARYLREVFEAGQSGHLLIAPTFAHLLDTKLIDDLDPPALYDLFFHSHCPSPRLRALKHIRVSTELYSEIGDLLSERGIKYRSGEFDALFDHLLRTARTDSSDDAMLT